MSVLHVTNAPERLNGTIHLPSSKSISNRILIIEALAGTSFGIQNISVAEDTIILKRLLSSSNHLLNAGNAGTAMRFLTAYCSLIKDDIIITGDDRMQKRPIAPLVGALRSMGAEIDYIGVEGFPPLHIRGGSLKGGAISIRSDISSQYISALLMIAPLLQNGLTLKLKGSISSEPYIKMTLSLMRYFGIEAEIRNDIITIKPQKYQIKEITIEADWSSASYWIGLACLLPGSSLRIPGLQKHSIQGDKVFLEIAERFFGVKSNFDEYGLVIESGESTRQSIEIDLIGHPDLIPTLVTLCCLAQAPFNITGTKNLTHKESDRAASLQRELIKLGYLIFIDQNSIHWNGVISDVFYDNLYLNTYADHRLAMCWAMLTVRHPNIYIESPEVVMKSYPSFWDEFQNAGFEFEYLSASV
ncbi:MAG: 3-phosphoshikimate 1-carboxyvinyltransferase [Bacteroidota bacterium]|nr:3-phosphoshikimate 1-carboxyvinyltransferase [Bacteroidota bacterium]